MSHSMETVEATSFAPSPATSRAAGAAHAGSVPGFAAPEREARGAFDGQEWTYRNGFDRILQRLPSAVWKNPQQQGWQRIKQNARREVWRAGIEGAVYYLKYYGGQDWVSWFKRVFRDSACRAEWTGGVYALRAGIAAVAPAGYTTSLRRAGDVCSLLVTEAAEPAYPLNEFWQQIEADDDPRRQRRDRTQLIELLGEMIARAHQAGFEHLDMHAANILVQPVAPARYRTLFVDLHSARLGVPISDRAVVRNLAQLNQWFRRHSNIGDRLRFVRAYLRWRNEYETEFDFGRPLGRSYRELVRALVVAADRHARRLWAQRDRRARRDGRYFARVRVRGGWRGFALLQTKQPSEESRASALHLERDWWREQLVDPLRRLVEDAGQTCKDSHSASVRRALLAHPAGNLPVIVKRPRARSWRRRLSQLWAPSRSVRGWQLGHALLHRNVATARPLAALERRIGPLLLDSVLITEAVPGGVDLETHLRQQFTTRPPPEWLRYKRELCRLTARHLRGLEECGFVHRDCKASNMLVLPGASPKLLWIDMDGLQMIGKPRSPRRRLRPLVCLEVSLVNMAGLTRTDRVRFLKCYCAGFGVGPQVWRAAWRALGPLVEKKLHVKAARREWKLTHYGRA